MGVRLGCPAGRRVSIGPSVCPGDAMALRTVPTLLGGAEQWLVLVVP